MSYIPDKLYVSRGGMAIPYNNLKHLRSKRKFISRANPKVVDNIILWNPLINFSVVRHNIDLLHLFHPNRLIDLYNSADLVQNYILTEGLTIKERCGNHRKGILKGEYQFIWIGGIGLKLVHIESNIYKEASKKQLSDKGYKNLEIGFVYSYLNKPGYLYSTTVCYLGNYSYFQFTHNSDGFFLLEPHYNEDLYLINKKYISNCKPQKTAPITREKYSILDTSNTPKSVKELYLKYDLSTADRLSLSTITESNILDIPPKIEVVKGINNKLLALYSPSTD